MTYRMRRLVAVLTAAGMLLGDAVPVAAAGTAGTAQVQGQYSEDENQNMSQQGSAPDSIDDSAQEPTGEDSSSTAEKGVSDTSEAGQEDESIYTAEDLQKIIQNPSGEYRLMADISLESITAENGAYLPVTFSGTLDGGGYQVTGLSAPLFQNLQQADIRNLHLQGDLIEEGSESAPLALYAQDSYIYNFSFQGNLEGKRTAGIVLDNENSVVEYSFVNAEQTASLEAAGMFLSGYGTVKGSYVSGSIQAGTEDGSSTDQSESRVYGFGVQGDITDSYLSASLQAQTVFLFHEEGNLTNCFYDLSMNTTEDENAKGYTTDQMTSGELSDIPFLQEKGSYPQMPQDIQSAWQKDTSEAAAKSTLSSDTDPADAQVEEKGTAKLKAAAVITPGLSGTEATTSLSLEMEDQKYYLVAEKDQKPEQPSSHAQALDKGWFRKLGTGKYTINGLSWNHAYDVWELGGDFQTMTKLGSVTTNKGILKGDIDIQGTLYSGQVLTAEITGCQTTTGQWNWYRATGKNAAGEWDWVLIQTGKNLPDNTSSSYTLTEAENGAYIKAEFTVPESADYQGAVFKMTEKKSATMLTGVSIQGKAEIGQTLKAIAAPVSCEQISSYTWYRSGEMGSIYSGSEYKIQSADIGHTLYVIVSGSEGSGAAGSVTSSHTEEVQALSVPPVTGVPVLKERTDTTLTFAMPAGSQGLYRFAYSEKETPDKTDSGEFHLLDSQIRDDAACTILNLKPDTRYYIWVQAVGEGGYLDSAFTDTCLAIGTTDKEHLAGSIELTGKYQYGETLTAALTSGYEAQTGNWSWYVLNGSTATELAGKTGTSIKIEEAYIGKRLKAVYTGTGDYSGTLEAVSDIIEKTEAPKVPGQEWMTGIVGTLKNDTQIQFTLPAASNLPADQRGEVYVGYSDSLDGAPKLWGTDSYQAGDTITITGLKRNTKYYLYLKFAETSIYKESGWSLQKHILSTEQTDLSRQIEIALSFPGDSLMPGDMLTAELTGTADLNYTLAETKGTWNWYETVPGGNETEITFEEYTDRLSTSYIVPNGKESGTTYRVVFTGSGGFTGSTQKESVAVSNTKIPYTAPKAPTPVETADGSLTLSMKDVTEGTYQFGYSLTNDIRTVQETEVTAFAATTVKISGLQRNKTYYLWAKRIGESQGRYSDSPWSTVSTAITKKTELGGYVTISGNAMFGETLTAAYIKADYLPEGDDSNGTWEWYRSKADGGWDVINGVTGTSYQLAQQDIGFQIKAVYNAAGDFKGLREVQSAQVSKRTQVATTVPTLTASSTSYTSEIHMTADVTTGSYYQIRKFGDAVPEAPESASESAGKGWNLASVSSFDVKEYYDVAAGSVKAIQPNTEYVIYTVFAGTSTHQPSTVTAGVKSMSGVYTQAGTITYSVNNSKNQLPVGGTLTAQLGSQNNIKGNWRWYVSDTDYNTANPTSWSQIRNGYAPTRDSASSILTITESMWGKYIRAEFIADTSAGYGGTLAAGKYASNVKKIYEETLTLTSSTKDGNGNPKAYAGTVLTGVLDNYKETGNLTANRTTVKFIIGSTDFTGVSCSGNTFTYTLPNNASLDGQTVKAVVSGPREKNLYLDNNLNAISGSTLDSQSSTGTYFNFNYGIPISSSEDMKNFILAQDKYTDRSAHFVLTGNIRMSDSDALTETQVKATPNFTGSLDGDFHTLTNLKSPMFYNVVGTSAKRAEIKNLISYNANIKTTYGIFRDTGMFGCSGDYVNIDKVFLMDSKLIGGYNTGYFFGYLTHANITNSGTAGGLCSASTSGGSFGGLIGSVRGGPSGGGILIKDVFSINTDYTSQPGVSASDNGGMIGYGSSNTGSAGVTMTNVYTANDVAIPNSTSTGTIVGTHGDLAVLNNAYYNWDSIKNKSFGFLNTYGIKSTTKDMVSNGLKTSFDALSSGLWTYGEGYYPRLTWIKDHPISNMYTATTGAFVPVDSGVTRAQLMEGNLYGTVQVPEELQKSSYSYSSSDTSVLKVTDGGTVIPVGSVGQSAKITIKYTEGDSSIGGTAENSYTFTVQKKLNALSSVQISGSPYAGYSLGASASGATSYQWYRRKSGSAVKEKINGATAQTYILKATDVGYEISVDVGASGYATMSSAFTNMVTALTPGAPTVADKSINSVSLRGNGLTGSIFEFAYSTTSTGSKTMVDGTATGSNTITVTGLSPNRTYYFYCRIAGGSGYNPSSWSTSTMGGTIKITVEGNITIGGKKSVGDTISATMPDTNLQTGNWKVERIAGSTITDLSSQCQISGDRYTVSYVLQTADNAKQIRFTYTGSGDYDGTKVATSSYIQSANQTAPAAPEATAVTDTSVTLKPYTDDADANYVYRYKNTKDSSFMEYYPSWDESIVTLSGLKPNQTYEIYARKGQRSGYAESVWSPVLYVTTERMDITTVPQITGNLEVESTVTIAKPADETVSVGLKIIDSSGDEATVTGYTEDSSQATYTIRPSDAGGKLLVTFRGTGDYSGTQSYTSVIIAKKQFPAPNAPAVLSEEVTDSSVVAEVSSGEGSFQFGYRRKADTGSTVTEYEGTVQQKTKLKIEGLYRNTEYEIYVKRVAEQGYIESNWSAYALVTTKKTEINGSIQASGAMTAGSTLTAGYTAGVYSVAAGGAKEDDTKGTFTWNGQNEAGQVSKLGDGPSYTLKDADTGKIISVTYTAQTGTNLTGSKTRKVGTVEKTAQINPLKCNVQTVNDSQEWSQLEIADSESGAWYMALPSSAALPELVYESEAAGKGWKVGNGGKLTFTGLVPNQSYIVYAARMETDAKKPSNLIASDAVRTAREELNDAIQYPANVQPMAATKVSISTYGKAPDGIWYWYSSDVDGAGAQWKLICTQTPVIEGNLTTASYKVPYQYSGKYVKAVFSASGDYTGSKETPAMYVADKQLTGNITYDKDYAAVEPIVFEPVTATYEGTDDQNGTWLWYTLASGETSWERVFSSGGSTSTYVPSKTDLGKQLKAEYHAVSAGFTGSLAGTATLMVGKAVQSSPGAPEILKIEKDRIQVRDAADYYTQYEKPKVQYGYRKAGASGITWSIQQAEPGGAFWIEGLDINTSYDIFVRYLETSVYQESGISSTPAAAVTSKDNLETEKVGLSYTPDAKTMMDVGKNVTAYYSGKGSGTMDGTWSIRRADGYILQNQSGSVSQGKNSMTYTLTAEDVGSAITFTYTASQASAYDGSVQVSTDKIVKKQAPLTTPVSPQCEAVTDSMILVKNIVSTQEYAITDETQAPAETSSKWAVLDSTGGTYLYQGLNRNTVYYIYTRVAETAVASVGDAVSVTQKTDPYVDIGTIKGNKAGSDGVWNEEMVNGVMNQPKGAGQAIEIPASLDTDGTLTVKSIQMKSGTYPDLSVKADMELNEFVGTDKAASPNVYEKGSSWADTHYAGVLVNGGSSGTDRKGNTSGLGSMTYASGEKIYAELYRANAVEAAGTYTVEFLVEDASGQEALLHAQVEISTQLKVTVPVKEDLQVDGRQISQTSNTRRLPGSSAMPAAVSVSNKASKGTGMPDLRGKLTKDESELTDMDEVYLKVSADGTDYTSPDGIWLSTLTETTEQNQDLAVVKASQTIPYKISGITGKGKVTWPWDAGDEKIVSQAYQLKFIYQIAE